MLTNGQYVRHTEITTGSKQTQRTAFVMIINDMQVIKMLLIVQYFC